MTVINETPLASRQDAYDRIRAEFSKPNAQLSKRDDDSSGAGNCFYRHPEDGRGCAIGCFLPDTLYRERFEGYGFKELANRAAENEPLLAEQLREFFNINSLAPEISDFLVRAQGFHDNARTVQEFIDFLDRDAKARGLSVPA